MGSTAFGASHPADTEPESSGRQLYGPPVVTMDRQTGRMRTGTGQLMKLKIMSLGPDKMPDNTESMWIAEAYSQLGW